MEKINNYTPGPLQFSHAIPERQFCAQVFDANGKAVATMDHMSDEGTANAKLYALAPTLYEQHFKMLEALKKAIPFVVVQCGLIPNGFEVVKEIEQTIKECEL